MRLPTTLVMGALFCLGAAAHTPAAPPTSPAESVDTLIVRLGDDNFQVRQDALDRLRVIGKPALPALRAATTNKDPEIRLRAAELVDDIQTDPIPSDIPEALRAGNGGFYPSTYHAEEHNGVRIVDAGVNGRKIHIERYPHNTKMMITGQIKGEPAVRVYRFTNLAELHRANPEAYIVYLAYIHGEGDLGMAPELVQPQRGLRPAGVIRPPLAPGVPPFAPLPPLAPRPTGNNNDLDIFERTLLDQMRQAQISDAQQREVTGLIDQMRQINPPNADPQMADARMEAYNRRSDELRTKLSNLKLPDPGDALPPPAASRLGITASEYRIETEGLPVTRVLPDSRAARLGLQKDDVIQKINGRPIQSATDLRRFVAQHPTDLVIEGTRDGKPFTAKDPASTK